jgi:phenylacetate-CoA ligase
MIDLYSRVFGRAVFPLLDRLNGTSIAEKLRFLDDAERWAPERIRARQEEKLAAVVSAAGQRSNFYRDFWRTLPSDRRVPSVHRALDGLPVLTKADLATASGAFPLPGYRGRVLTTHTSGSTGVPMTFYRTAEQESWFWALRFRIWGWAGYAPGEPYLEINLNPRVEWKKRLQDMLFRCTYETFNADNQDSKKLVDLLQRRPIRHLNGFASSLFVLAKYAGEHGVPRIPLVGVTSTGDGLYPTYRETIESVFGVRVLDYYGAGGEGVHVASQCPESGSRYHVLPENAVVELLGPDGPVPPGVAGRLVVTQLDNEVMPLVRYELGDVAVAAPDGERCACGRTLPLLERIEGRIPDLIVLSDGSFLVTHFFVVLFKGIQDIRRYQIVQERVDAITVRLMGKPGCRRDQVEAVVRRGIAAATRGLLTLDFEWLEEDIPLTGRGKRRLVISTVGRQALGGTRAGAEVA